MSRKILGCRRRISIEGLRVLVSSISNIKNRFVKSHQRTRFRIESKQLFCVFAAVALKNEIILSKTFKHVMNHKFHYVSQTYTSQFIVHGTAKSLVLLNLVVFQLYNVYFDDSVPANLWHHVNPLWQPVTSSSMTHWISTWKWIVMVPNIHLRQHFFKKKLKNNFYVIARLRHLVYLCFRFFIFKQRGVMKGPGDWVRP